MCVCVVLGVNAQKSYYNMEQLTTGATIIVIAVIIGNYNFNPRSHTGAT